MGNLLTTAAAKSVPSFNEGFVSDPHIDRQVNALDAQPAESVASGWAALDKYVNYPAQATWRRTGTRRTPRSTRAA